MSIPNLFFQLGQSLPECVLIDLGSGGSQDITLQLIQQMRGLCLAVDAGTDNPQHAHVPNMTVSPVKSFITQKGGTRRFFTFPNSLTNTFDPKVDDLLLSLRNFDDKQFDASYSFVPTIGIEDLCLQNNCRPDFLKADIEGLELPLIQELSESGLAPLMIEAEINLGEKSYTNNAGHFIDELDSLGYRLIDMRTTYKHPKNLNLNLPLEDKPAEVYLPYDSGLLFLIDGLFIQKSIIDRSIPISLHHLPTIGFLCAYRKFTTALYLLDKAHKSTLISDQVYDQLVQLVLQIRAGFTSLFSEDPIRSALGLNPPFSWCKNF